MSIYLTEVGGQRIQLERKWKNKQETFVFKVIGLENLCTQGAYQMEGAQGRENILKNLLTCTYSTVF